LSTINKELLASWIKYVSLSPEEKLQYKQLIGRVKCPFCGKEFDDDKEAYKHIQDEHQQDDPEDLKII